MQKKIIQKHLLLSNHSPDIEDFFILTINNNEFKVTLIDKPLINVDHICLNENKQSLPYFTLSNFWLILFLQHVLTFHSTSGP